MKKLLLILTLLSLPLTETSPVIFNLSKPVHINRTMRKVNTGKIYTIYAYCPCAKCCGKETGITASGTNATEGRTVASDLPFGMVLEIEGLGEYIVEDRGVKGKVIDVFMDRHEDCVRFGRKELRVWIK